MLACAFLWSTGGLFIKLIDWNPFFIAGLRSMIGVVILALYMKMAHLQLKVNRQSILSGVSLCLVFLCYVTANKLTTAANTVVLQYTNPVFVVILSALFLHQRFSRRDLLVVGLVFLGVTLSFLDGLNAGNLLGNLLALASGLFLAVLFLNSSRCETDSDSMSGILLGQLFTGLAGLPFFFLDPPVFTPISVASILFLGVFQLGLPYVFYGIASRSCSPLICSVLAGVEPLLNPVWVFVVMGELPGPVALLGCGIVIVTITFWCVQNARPQSN